MQAKSTNRGALLSPAVPIAGIAGVNAPFPGEAFRNLSLPTTAVDSQRHRLRRGGVAERPGHRRCSATCREIGRADQARRAVGRRARRDARRPRTPTTSPASTTRPAATGSGRCRARTSCCSGRTNGGRSYQKPGARQPGRRQRRRRPVPAVDGRHAVRPGQHLLLRPPQRPGELLHRHVPRALRGRRAHVHRHAACRSAMWDPAVNAPTSVSGKFIGDYQGLVADDEVAIPFWNDTQLTNAARATRSTRPTRRSSPRACPTMPRDESARAACARYLAIGVRSIGALHAALDARPRRPAPRPARADGPRRAALLRQGRRQHRCGLHEGRAASALAATTCPTLPGPRGLRPALLLSTVCSGSRERGYSSDVETGLFRIGELSRRTGRERRRHPGVGASLRAARARPQRGELPPLLGRGRRAPAAHVALRQPAHRPVAGGRARAPLQARRRSTSTPASRRPTCARRCGCCATRWSATTTRPPAGCCSASSPCSRPASSCATSSCPYLGELGDRWQKGEVSVAQEHFASCFLESWILTVSRGYGRSGRPPRGARLRARRAPLPRAGRLRPRAARPRLAGHLPRRRHAAAVGGRRRRRRRART